MLAPKKLKYRKQQKGRVKGIAWTGTKVSYGEYGIQSLEPGLITARQIEAGRVALSRSLKRGGKVFVRMFPHKPITKKPLETRMGKGKGNVEDYVCVVHPGRVLYEVDGCTEAEAREAFRLAAHKMPLATRFVARENSL